MRTFESLTESQQAALQWHATQAKEAKHSHENWSEEDASRYMSDTMLTVLRAGDGAIEDILTRHKAAMAEKYTARPAGRDVEREKEGGDPEADRGWGLA